MAPRISAGGTLAALDNGPAPGAALRTRSAWARGSSAAPPRVAAAQAAIDHLVGPPCRRPTEKMKWRSGPNLSTSRAADAVLRMLLKHVTSTRTQKGLVVFPFGRR